MLNPAIEWLEQQAAAYHEAHQDPVLGPKLPPVPAYLAHPGVEQDPGPALTTTVSLPSGGTARITHAGPIPPSTLRMLDETAQDMRRERDEAEATP